MEEENKFWEVEIEKYLGRKEEWDGKVGGHFRYGRRWGRNTEDQEFESRYIAVGEGDLEVATRKSQMVGTQEIPRNQ